MSKRIMKDYSELSKNSEFVLHYDEGNIRICDILFFGPKDTPYENGIFILQVEFGDSYPQEPPKVIFKTGGIIDARIHPNLYRDGKVCLSILGTWGKYEWSPLLTLEKVCLTIKALLDDNPIENEPGYEKVNKNDTRAIAYKVNARYLTLKTIQRTTSTIPSFQKAIEDHKKANKSFFLESIQTLEPYQNQTLGTLHHTTPIKVIELKPFFEAI
jgi:ubiquitin-protein ligase